MKKTLSLRPIMHIMRRYEKRHTLVGMEYDEAMRCALELAGQAQPLVTYRLVRWCWMRPARLSGADTTRVRLMATRLPTPKSSPCVRRPKPWALGISPIARWPSHLSRARCARVPASRPISAPSRSVPGIPSSVHAVRFGTFPAIRMSGMCRRSRRRSRSGMRPSAHRLLRLTTIIAGPVCGLFLSLRKKHAIPWQ